MSSTQDYVDFVHERIGFGARITSRKMFGEYALYLDGKVLVLICDNSVYLKPLPANDALAKGLPQGSPYPGAKAHWVLDELLEDTDRLQEILQVTADALPAPKPKTKKAAKTSKAASTTTTKPAKTAVKTTTKKVAKKATKAAPKPRKT